MHEKIENSLTITCEDADLTKLSNIEFYVRQLNFFGCYTPTVVSPNEMLVVIPFEDAMKMVNGKAKLQFAFTDENGTPDASEVLEVQVGDLLKEAGYAPV
jgi:hypothetical protein